MSGGSEYTSSFMTALALLGMEPNKSNLYFVSQKDELRNVPDLFIHLEQAERFEADAVYFRYFDDGRPPRPQLYIFNRSSDFSIDENEAKQIHKKLWNAGIVPLFYIVSKSELNVFNTLDGKAEDGEFISTPFESIDLIGEAENARFFSARQFDSGLFWENEHGIRINDKNSSYQQLLSQLKNVRKKIVSTRKGADYEKVIKRLLVIIVLIKYLEERKDNDGKSALPKGFYREFLADDGEAIEDVIQNANALIAMLEKLSKKEQFNGKVFQLSTKEKALIPKLPLNLFASFAKGDIDFAGDKTAIGQKQIWRLYSFEFLPIDLISHIYEEFLTDEFGTRKEGVVYTPPYLVQFLVDQCLPLEKVPEHIKVLDPACGSGIFLVGVFKRLVQAWRRRNQWKRPRAEDIPELQSLLKDSIYGCDIEDDAVDLTYFSLSLALLDALSPKEIWGNVHFHNLIDENLLKGDFFQLILDEKLPNDFDLVIGNPPFNSKLTEAAVTVNANEIAAKQRPDVPDKQIALLFLEQGFKLLKPNGRNCLILSAGPLIYNKNSFDFRKNIFSRFHFEVVFDFIAQRQSLFKGSSSKAAPASIAVSAVNKEPVETDLTYHVILRRSNASKDKVEFETDYYDIHCLKINKIIAHESIWLSNFFGGGRLLMLSNEIVKRKSLRDFLKKKKKDGWRGAEGYTERFDFELIQRVEYLSSKSNLSEPERKEFIDLHERFYSPWIYEKRIIDADNLESFYDNKIFSEKRYYYRSSKKNKEIFQPPHLIIRKSFSEDGITSFYSNEYIAFSKSFFWNTRTSKGLS